MSTEQEQQEVSEVYSGLTLQITRNDGHHAEVTVKTVIRPYNEHGREMFYFVDTHGRVSWAYTDTRQEVSL